MWHFPLNSLINFSKEFSELSRLKKNDSEDSWSKATPEYSEGSCFSRTRDEETCGLFIHVVKGFRNDSKSK